MMVPAGGGGRSGGKSSGKKRSKKSSDSNSGMIIGLSVGIGGVAILAAVLVFVLMGRGGDNGNGGNNNVASNPSPASTTTSPSTTTPNTSLIPGMTNTPMGGHDATSGQYSTPMPTTTAQTATPMTSGDYTSGSQLTVSDPTASSNLALDASATTNDPPVKPSTANASTGDSGLPAVPDADMELVDLIRFVQPGVVRLEVETEFGSGLGSGFVVNKQGMVVTNYHVIEGAVNAKAFFETGEEFPVTGVWHLDSDRDIAVIQIECPPEKLFPVNIATELPAQGIDVAALGAPHGLSFTVTKGIVSAIRSGEELDHTGTLIQHDVSINPGNSGGPLVTFRGEVVAINTFLLRGSQNLNFAISCVDIRDCLDKPYSEMLAVNPENIPSEHGEIPGAVDYSDTERGDTLLARIHEMDIVTFNLAQDPSGVIARYLEEASENQLDRAGIDTNQIRIYELDEIDFRNPVMLIIYHFTLPEDEEVNALEVMVHMQVIMVDVTAEGKQELCIVWTREEERIGSVAPAALIRGQLPTSVRSGLTGFIGEFVSRQRRARNN